MKSAVDLLGLDRRLVQEQNRDVEYLLTEAQLELVAKRAREEMRELAADAAETGQCVDMAMCDHRRCHVQDELARSIRALPVEAAK